MKFSRVICLVLVVVMITALLPVTAMAEGVSYAVNEIRAMNTLDKFWAKLSEVESNYIEAKAGRESTISAVYEAALNIESVDKDSFSDFSRDGFFFKVDGMLCSYNYRLRNELDGSADASEPGIITVKGSSAEGAKSDNVLLVAPYYGHDSSFTDQYKNEAQSIADATGGDYTLIQSLAATGPAIAEAYPDAGIVIYDSHGIATNSSSYLCLTTSSGMTSTDYQNGWAVNAGSEAYIDGRYIENHAASELPNTIVWMAICEGMKASGQGVTAEALLRAGAGVVYGYSQSVTFVGDYLYEACFWNVMKQGGTVAEAYAAMVDEYGVPDPYGDSYPIVVSDVDPYPANPDAAQTVYSQYSIFGSPDPVALESFNLSEDSIDMLLGTEATVDFVRVPENANQYTLEWTSSNPQIANVNGNNRRCVITGVSSGNAVVTCKVIVGGEIIGSAQVSVSINADAQLASALNADGQDYEFGNSAEYPFEVVDDGDRVYARSTNQGANSSSSFVNLTVYLLKGDRVTFDWKVSSTKNYDWFYFKVNGETSGRISGTSGSYLNWSSRGYTANDDGWYTFEWVYQKTTAGQGDDTACLDNVKVITSYVPPTPQFIPGDVNDNGALEQDDALRILRHSLNIALLTGDELTRADANEDGSVTSDDALLVLRSALEI